VHLPRDPSMWGRYGRGVLGRCAGGAAPLLPGRQLGAARRLDLALLLHPMTSAATPMHGGCLACTARCLGETGGEDGVLALLITLVSDDVSPREAVDRLCPMHHALVCDGLLALVTRARARAQAAQTQKGPTSD